eukprot:106828_1
MVDNTGIINQLVIGKYLLSFAVLKIILNDNNKANIIEIMNGIYLLLFKVLNNILINLNKENIIEIIEWIFFTIISSHQYLQILIGLRPANSRNKILLVQITDLKIHILSLDY